MAAQVLLRKSQRLRTESSRTTCRQLTKLGREAGRGRLSQRPVLQLLPPHLPVWLSNRQHHAWEARARAHIQQPWGSDCCQLLLQQGKQCQGVLCVPHPGLAEVSHSCTNLPLKPALPGLRTRCQGAGVLPVWELGEAPVRFMTLFCSSTRSRYWSSLARHSGARPDC